MFHLGLQYGESLVFHARQLFDSILTAIAKPGAHYLALLLKIQFLLIDLGILVQQVLAGLIKQFG